MDFIELTHHKNKKKVSVSISKIIAIFEVENSSYGYATRIILSSGDYFGVDESYETIMKKLYDNK